VAEGMLICRRCGAANPAGDQFCGTCGAFLEWEGEAGAPTEPVPPPVAAPVEPAVVLPGSVACPACGTLNPPGRTFCQTCGATLAASGTAPLARPAPGPAPARSASEASAASSGGLPGWLPLVAGVGLLVGVAVVVYVLVLRPTPPTSPATAGSSATLTPTMAPPSGGSAAGSSAGSSAAASVQLTATGAKASSVVGNKKEFDAAKAIDGRLDTCWQEGATDEAGQWLEIALAPSRLDYIVVYAGYQLSHDAFLANRRPQNVLVSVNGGPKTAFELADSEQPQRLDIDDVAGAKTVRIEIVTSYDPQATAYPGSPFDDLAISEIRAFGEAGG
jgi:ribosomal protein L40E